jgi:hypothetical protein
MAITKEIEDKGQALLDVIQNDAPGLYARLAAVLASINVERQKRSLKPMGMRDWLIDGLVAAAIGPELMVKHQEAEERLQKDRMEATEKIEAELRAAL